MSTTMSRRRCLQGLGVLMGSALGTRALGGLPLARASSLGKAAVVSIFFEGGFNALFSSADSFMTNNTFGVTSLNVKNVGNGLFVDNGTIGSLGSWALSHMAAIGNRHGAIDHGSAQKNNFLDDKSQSFVVQLAAAMGGTAAFKAVALGNLPPGPPSSPINGVSIQLLRNMGDVASAVGAGPVDFNRPARNVAASAIAKAKAMSQRSIDRNTVSLASAKDGYDTLADSLGKPVLPIDIDATAKAYNARAGNLDSVAAKLAAAEVMIRAGTNVITLGDTGWDTHGDRTGTTVRQRMSSDVIPPLKTFLARLRSDPALSTMNVTVLLHGDFARSLPGSDHAPALSALAIGPNVKVGTTGRVSANVTLPETVGASRQMWAYLAALSQTAQNPFGPNPHALVLE